MRLGQLDLGSNQSTSEPYESIVQLGIDSDHLCLM